MCCRCQYLLQVNTHIHSLQVICLLLFTTILAYVQIIIHLWEHKDLLILIVKFFSRYIVVTKHFYNHFFRKTSQRHNKSDKQLDNASGKTIGLESIYINYLYSLCLSDIHM